MPGSLRCPGWYINREPFLDVIRMHRASVNNINKSNVPAAPLRSPQAVLGRSSRPRRKIRLSQRPGHRLAPTGTIGFMMDLRHHWLEPDLALVKYKKLVGGGMIKIVNRPCPPRSSTRLHHEQTDAIVSYIDATGPSKARRDIKDEHLAVFDCSFKPARARVHPYMGHLKMMAATQPFISGAISKTVNCRSGFG
jgi:ribonucleoside-diphosphate reductase alpha chain